MSSKPRFELNLKGLNEIMKSEDMQKHLSTIVTGVQLRAGSGYESKVTVATYEALGKIYPSDAISAMDNLNNNTLEKALGGLPRTKE